MLPLSKLRVLVLSAVLLTPLAARGDEHGYYVQFNAGAVVTDNFSEGRRFCDNFFGCGSFNYQEESDPGYVAGAAVGYRFNDNFRLEGEAMYQSNDLDNSSLKANTQRFDRFTNTSPLEGEHERVTFLINGYYDFKNSTAFTPYLTGGIGGYHLEIDADRGRRSGENELDFAWQLGAGVNYQLDKRLSFDLKYRYLSGTEAEVVIPSDLFLRDRTEFHDVGDHQVVVGIRVGL